MSTLVLVKLIVFVWFGGVYLLTFCDSGVHRRLSFSRVVAWVLLRCSGSCSWCAAWSFSSGCASEDGTEVLMASAKSSRSRVLNNTAAKSNNPMDSGNKLEENLNVFKSDNFDADGFVQSKCNSLNEKV
ncbi:Exocyst complex component EXO84B [Camellia lanceoleosa]|uniref:Exocyst complex component EXO84B n=1 Tax=Camellia lanceoleosa TaxID=1840588 RepID=A0ACC0I2G8_9ERIC|nr:Exocyst complex component EXO84B [Camellia lanceoleosa]